MNYIKEAEKHLRYYKDLDRSIVNMDRQIGRLVSKAGPKSLTAIVLDDVKVQSSAHDETINIIYEIQLLTANKAKTQEELDKIDRILDEISQEHGCELYGKVLRKWYIEQKSKEVILEELHYSENSRRSVYNIKNEAIRKFAVTLFGIEALKAI